MIQKTKLCKKKKVLIYFDKREIKLINLPITVHLSETEDFSRI